VRPFSPIVEPRRTYIRRVRVMGRPPDIDRRMTANQTPTLLNQIQHETQPSATPTARIMCYSYTELIGMMSSRGRRLGPARRDIPGAARVSSDLSFPKDWDSNPVLSDTSGDGHPHEKACHGGAGLLTFYWVISPLRPAGYPCLSFRYTLTAERLTCLSSPTIHLSETRKTWSLRGEARCENAHVRGVVIPPSSP